MMVSNGYSARRVFLRRPKVCKSSPNPGRCHPPLPPWPLFPFPLRWIAVAPAPHTAFDFDVTIILTSTALPNVYVGTLYLGTSAYSAVWTITESPDVGFLQLDASIPTISIQSKKFAEPYTPDVVVVHDIVAWDSQTPYSYYSEAFFDF